MTPAIRLRYFFDWGTTTCLWSGDDQARARFGYAIAPHDLPLSPALDEQMADLAVWHDRFLNWNDPTGPHGRNADECRRFNEASARLLLAIRQALGPDFDIVDETTPVTADDQPAGDTT